VDQRGSDASFLGALRRSMRIRYSPRAVRDLESIREYLAKTSPKAAVNVLTAIYGAIEFIRRHPEGTEATPISGVRAKIVPRYRFRIFYRILASDDAVEIIHVRHTSRRPWSGGHDYN
jgi:toxin ParE1/3/4